MTRPTSTTSWYCQRAADPEMLGAMRARRRLIGFAAAFAGLAAATVYAQRIWVGGPTGGYWRGGPPAG